MREEAVEEEEPETLYEDAEAHTAPVGLGVKVLHEPCAEGDVAEVEAEVDEQDAVEGAGVFLGFGFIELTDEVAFLLFVSSVLTEEG